MKNKFPQTRENSDSTQINKATINIKSLSFFIHAKHFYGCKEKMRTRREDRKRNITLQQNGI